ncbi:MAG: ribonuclease H-like domain-containing protein [Bacillota bacterium]
MQLKDKLGELVQAGLVKVGPVGLKEAPRRSAHGIEAVVPGRVLTTAHGPVFIAEDRRPADAAHGGVPLAEALHLERRHLAALALDDGLGDLDLSRAVFLDTETSGLGLGTGTYVFLVGLGFFDGDDYVTRQYFLRDVDEEPAFLTALQADLERFEAIVTFNGKAFDLPLLENRFVLARRRPRLPDGRHLDLRHAAARLWRERLTSCSLQALESGILGFVREGDVPGELIPLLYFDYLRSGDARIIEPVFTHNRADILSLTALTVKAAAVVADPLGDAASDPADRFSVARLLERLGRLEDSLACYEAALAAGPAPTTREKAARHLARLYKRIGRLEQAVGVWRRLVEEPGWTVHAHVELAKYYEHRARDYDQAIAVVQAALTRLATRATLAGTGARSPWANRLEDLPEDSESGELRHRLARLRAKKARRA